MMEAERQVKSVCADATARGGVLVFFPSYMAMESTAERWKSTGMFDTLKHAIGSIIIEPKGGSNAKAKAVESTKIPSSGPSSNNSNNAFMVPARREHATSANGEDGEDDNFATVVDEFNNAIKKYHSCLLLAVCRYELKYILA
jgi:hypothetical protein